MLQIKNRGFSFFLDEKVRHDYMFRKRQLKRKINIKFLFKKKTDRKRYCLQKEYRVFYQNDEMLLNGLRRCYKDISNTGVTPKSIMMNEGSYMLYSFIYMEFYTRKMHIRTQSTPSLV